MQNYVLKSLKGSHHVNDETKYSRFCVWEEQLLCLVIDASLMHKKISASIACNAIESNAGYSALQNNVRLVMPF